MSDRASKWGSDFKQAQISLSNAQAEMQRLELLGSQSASASQRSERVKQGALIRGKVSQVKIELERLQRELDALSSSSMEHEVTRKSISQYKDDLGQMFVDLQALQQRVKRGGGASSSPPLSFAGDPKASAEPFQRLPGEPPATLRQQMDRQQDVIRSFDQPLADIEGSVENLKNVGGMIHSEILLQTRMIDDTSHRVDRTNTRMGGARTLLSRVTARENSRWLGCSIVVLTLVLILILVYALGR